VHKGDEVVIVVSVRKSECACRRADEACVSPWIEREVHRSTRMRQFP
jgi:hypothetical protein